MARQVPTALRAPGIRSGGGGPKIIEILYGSNPKLQIPSSKALPTSKIPTKAETLGFVLEVGDWEWLELGIWSLGFAGYSTTNAGTCPPPEVTLASPLVLSRVR